MRLKALLINPAGGTKEIHLPAPVREIRVPLLSPLPAFIFSPNEPLSALPIIAMDIYRLVAPIEKAGPDSVLLYEWERTEK